MPYNSSCKKPALTEGRQRMFVVAMASPAETRATLKRMLPEKKEVYGGTPFLKGSFAGRDIVLVRTGIGAKKAATAANRIVQQYAGSCVIIAGAAGAADTALNIGDIVVTAAILLQSGEVFLCDELRTKKAFELLEKSGFSARSGACLTIDRFVHRKSEKKEIFKRFGAHVIDMESGVIARRLREAGIPFLNVRVVSDSARHDTADVESLYRKKKQAGFAGAGRHFLQRPSELIKTARLMKDMRRTSSVIADVVELLVQSL